MQNIIQYEEGWGEQDQTLEPILPKPYKIKPMFFVDIGHTTVAKANNLPDALDLLKNYPEGTLRHWEPTQKEYAEQLAKNKELSLHNWGIMTN